MAEKLSGRILYKSGAAILFECERVEQRLPNAQRAHSEIVLHQASLRHLDAKGRAHGEVTGQIHEPTFHAQVTFGGPDMTVEFGAREVMTISAADAGTLKIDGGEKS